MKSFTVLPARSSATISSRALRTIFVLNPPQRPRSAVATTTSTVSDFPLPTRSSGPPSAPAIEAAKFPIIAPRRSEYGRDASAASCALRSFAAATICMALVIFCVFFTLPIRFFSSLREAMRLPLSREVVREGFQHVFDLTLDLIR